MQHPNIGRNLQILFQEHQIYVSSCWYKFAKFGADIKWQFGVLDSELIK